MNTLLGGSKAGSETWFSRGKISAVTCGCIYLCTYLFINHLFSSESGCFEGKSETTVSKSLNYDRSSLQKNFQNFCPKVKVFYSKV